MISRPKPFKGRSRRARKRRDIRESKGITRTFGFVDDAGKFHATVRIKSGDNLTEALIQQALK